MVKPVKQPALTVVYHGHCFDGMASAAVFTRLARALHGADLVVDYRGLDHQPGGTHVPEAALTGEMNAVVDFRYTRSPKLTYWFDHHLTGLVGDEERAHFAADASGRKHFDPDYGSCCRLIADRARDRFGVDLSAMADLIHWAHVMDTAGFASAEAAISLTTPAQQLATVIEVHGNTRFLKPRIGDLARGATLEELARDAKVQRLLGPLREAHHRNCEVVRQRARLEAGVVEFDLIGSGEDRYNKFIPYALFPEARYSVAVTAGRSRAKVSVGSNPWSTRPRTHNIAELCGRYGGGGHAVVGAVSLKPDAVERAREIAAEVARSLRSEPAS